MASQLQKYLHFNAAKPALVARKQSITFVPVRLTSRNCIYYDGSKQRVSRTSSQRSAFSQRSSCLSSRSSFMGLDNPPVNFNGGQHPRIQLHACIHPSSIRQAQQLQRIEQKRSQVQRLRRSLSQRKVMLQQKYHSLLQRSTAIRHYYEQQRNSLK